MTARRQATARQVISSTTKSEEIRVKAPAPAAVVRSVAWDSGWTATVSVNGGRPRSVPVNDFDLVQEVHIPAGNDVVTFHYRPPHLLVASVLSLGRDRVLLLALLAAWLVRRRRPRPRARRPGRSGAGGRSAVCPSAWADGADPG